LKDIPKEFKEVDILLLEKLVNMFLTDPGQYLRLDELAKELKRSKLTLYKALFYLEFSMLIRKILNYRPSIGAASRKPARIYPYHPCLTLPFNVPEERFAENLVLFELNARHYWRDGGKEIDFLKDLTPIEVKIKRKIEKEDLRWIKFFLKKYNAKKAYVITKNVEDRIDAIHLIPLWQFCFKGL
jgi:predicted AAA+ superfamily ATPase